MPSIYKRHTVLIPSFSLFLLNSFQNSKISCKMNWTLMWQSEQFFCCIFLLKNKFGFLRSVVRGDQMRGSYICKLSKPHESWAMKGPLSAHSGQQINFVGIQKIQKKYQNSDFGNWASVISGHKILT